jgi:hypothetical protein
MRVDRLAGVVIDLAIEVRNQRLFVVTGELDAHDSYSLFS